MVLVTNYDELLVAAQNKEPEIEFSQGEWIISDFDIDWELRVILRGEQLIEELDEYGIVVSSYKTKGTKLIHTNITLNGVPKKDGIMCCEVGTTIGYFNGATPEDI